MLSRLTRFFLNDKAILALVLLNTLSIFIGGILGMYFINSIFVDAAVSDNNDEVIDRLDGDIFPRA